MLKKRERGGGNGSIERVSSTPTKSVAQGRMHTTEERPRKISREKELPPVRSDLCDLYCIKALFRIY